MLSMIANAAYLNSVCIDSTIKLRIDSVFILNNLIKTVVQAGTAVFVFDHHPGH